MLRPTLLFILGLTLSGSALPVLADSRQDHDVARQALAAGEILPLRKVLERIERTHPGEVLEVELERENGRWVYEVKLLRRDGGVQKLLLDARDGTLLDQRSKQRRHD